MTGELKERTKDRRILNMNDESKIVQKTEGCQT